MSDCEFECITLGRTACYGEYPVYTVKIYHSGQIDWHGEMFVEKVGRYTWTISSKKITELASLCKKYDYFSFKDNYKEYEITDNPSYITSIQYKDGRYKQVNHYHGDFKAPEELTKFEKKRWF